MRNLGALNAAVLMTTRVAVVFPTPLLQRESHMFTRRLVSSFNTLPVRELNRLCVIIPVKPLSCSESPHSRRLTDIISHHLVSKHHMLIITRNVSERPTQTPNQSRRDSLFNGRRPIT